MSADERPPRRRAALVLALASPMIAELLSSSAPPLQFFIYWIFVLFVLFYGCAAILIRELTVRRSSGWRGVLLMGAAFGILNEGPAARAFFDPASRSLGDLTQHGHWLGVNWIWAIDAVLYHAVFSAALPILLVNILFPEASNVPWLRRKHLVGVTLLFAFGTAVFLGAQPKYPVPDSYLVVCYLLIAALVALATRKSAASAAVAQQPLRRPPSHFVALGFLATTGLLLHIFVVPSLVRVPLLTALALAGGMIVVWRLLTSWTGHGTAWNREQQYGLFAGAVGCLAVLALFHEINPTRTYDATGMAVVGVVTLAALVWLRRRVGRAAPAAQGAALAGK